AVRPPRSARWVSGGAGGVSRRGAPRLHAAGHRLPARLHRRLPRRDPVEVPPLPRRRPHQSCPQPLTLAEPRTSYTLREQANMELFAHPWYMAFGGLLISVPIIIHLINRMRFKIIRWAAMEFLLKSQKRNQRRMIIEQLILLLLRILLVL